MTTLVLIVIVILVCVFCAGLIAEASRIAPKTPEQLYWALPIRYLEIDGNRIRYIRTIDFHPRQGTGAGGDDHAAPQRGFGKPHLAGRCRRSPPSHLGFMRSPMPRACGPVTITPSSISFAKPITGTRRGSATGRSTFRCSWSIASRTGRTLKSATHGQVDSWSEGRGGA